MVKTISTIQTFVDFLYKKAVIFLPLAVRRQLSAGDCHICTVNLKLSAADEFFLSAYTNQLQHESVTLKKRKKQPCMFPCRARYT